VNSEKSEGKITLQTEVDAYIMELKVKFYTKSSQLIAKQIGTSRSRVIPEMIFTNQFIQLSYPQ
jgi:hypothetical protein